MSGTDDDSAEKIQKKLKLDVNNGIVVSEKLPDNFDGEYYYNLGIMYRTGLKVISKLRSSDGNNLFGRGTKSSCQASP